MYDSEDLVERKIGKERRIKRWERWKRDERYKEVELQEREVERNGTRYSLSNQIFFE